MKNDLQISRSYQLILSNITRFSTKHAVKKWLSSYNQPTGF